jgi:hypothetical protein
MGCPDAATPSDINLNSPAAGFSGTRRDGSRIPVQDFAHHARNLAKNPSVTARSPTTIGGHRIR